MQNNISSSRSLYILICLHWESCILGWIVSLSRLRFWTLIYLDSRGSGENEIGL